MKIITVVILGLLVLELSNCFAQTGMYCFL